MVKVCSVCLERPTRNKTADNCNICYCRLWRKANPEKMREGRRRYCRENKESIAAWMKAYSRKFRLAQYGLTEEQFKIMLESQNGQCAIGCEPFSANLIPVVDHDHTTGKVRGLLCKNCNTGIGMLKDSPHHLISALNYIEDHKLGIKR